MQAIPATDRNRRLRTGACARRAAGIAVLMGLGFASQMGCTVCQNARRTLLQEPSQFSWKWDRGRSLKVYRQWADQAWAAESGSCPDGEAVDQYALGFRDGFVDYVYAGGDGQPPPVPPRQFWNVAWRTPEGDAGAKQWFAGYRHGAQSAHNGGYRQGGVVNAAYGLGADPGPWVNAESQSEIDSTSPLQPPIETVPAPTEAPPETQPETMPPSNGESLPAPPRAPASELSPPTADPFGGMLPAEEEPAAGVPADAAPGRAAPEGAAPVDGTAPADSAPLDFEIPTGEVNPAAAIVPANRGAQRFRRAVTTFRMTSPSAAP